MWFREPDLLLLCDGDDARYQDRYWLGADLVVEVVSPDRPERDLIDSKYSVYRCGSSGHNRNGVLRNEVWEDSGEVRMGARRHAGAR